MNVTNANVSRRAVITSTNAIKNINATVAFKTDKLAVGDTQTGGIMFGYQDSNNHYLAQLLFNPSGATDSVQVRLRKRVSGTYTTLGATVTLAGVEHSANDLFHIRVSHLGYAIKVRGWKDGTAEPSTWDIEIGDSAYTVGQVGIRSVCDALTSNTPVIFSYSNLVATGSWDSDPSVTNDIWARLLPAPFDGTVDESWLDAALIDTSPDAAEYFMRYVNGGSVPTEYGPLNADGTRQEGSDWNDCLGVDATYGSTTVHPDPAALGCVDCSGYLRLGWGNHMGYPMRLTLLNGVSIPRISSDISDFGPGVLIVPDTGAQVTAFDKLIPWIDTVSFDADTSNPNEEEGQIDHLGPYVGIDNKGNYRFLSSRKTPNGPTLSDLGGPSILNGSSLYGRSWRSIRRF